MAISLTERTASVWAFLTAFLSRNTPQQPAVANRIEDYRNGYPRFAALFNADPGFCIFRRFGNLYARSLLLKQDKLLELEAQLNELDANEDRQLYLKSRRYDGNPERKDLLEQIDIALHSYGSSSSRYLHRNANRSRNGCNLLP
ncbi:MAG: hypothetical protein M1816_003336 [Peltula sp. TS41687]|nr:MAG: hypothetical protein M1816_003336 [Peltula sp. TS41687]